MLFNWLVLVDLTITHMDGSLYGKRTGESGLYFQSAVDDIVLDFQFTIKPNRNTRQHNYNSISTASLDIPSRL